METIPPARRTVTRMEIRSMPSTLQDRFVRALKRMMENPNGPGSSVFARLASIHGYPGRIYCAHRRESFPAWHRAYLVAFERALQEADAEFDDGDGNIGLPYWDWAQITVNGQVYPEVIRREFGVAPDGLLDPNDREVQSRPDLRELVRDGYRQIQDDDRAVRSWLGRLGVQVDAALRVPEHYLFASTDQPDGIEWPHNTVHGRLGFPMDSVPVASFHPIFWLHHCNIDRQFAKYEELMPRAEQSFRDNQASPGGIGPGDTNPDATNWYTSPLTPFVYNGRSVSVSDTFDDTFNRYRYDSLPRDPNRRFGIRTRDLPTQLEFTLEASKIATHTYTFFVFVMRKEEADAWVPPEDVSTWYEHPSMADSLTFFGGMDPEECEGCRQEGTIVRYADITQALARLGLSRHDCGIRVMVADGYKTVKRLEDVPEVPAPKLVGSLFESVSAPLAKGGEATPQAAGEVKGLQKFLKRYGWLKEEADGVFGDATEAAVKRFQKFAGLVEDGVAGPTTKGKILQERVDGVSDQDDEDDVATYQRGQEVEYWVGPPPSYLNAEAALVEVRAAFAAWAEVTGVLFKEVGSKGECKVAVGWGRRSPDNIFMFDGPGGALAHSTKDYIQLDNSERWLCQGQPAEHGSYYLYPVVLHSVGHVLGLTSSSCGDDVMSPFYFPDRVELQPGDKGRAAALYGV